MWLAGRSRKPGPTGTGTIAKRWGWYFWDDAVCPGLIDWQVFDKLADQILESDERFRIHDDVKSSDRRYERRRERERERLYGKIAAHLKRQRVADVGQARALLVDGWDPTLASQKNTGLHMYDHKGWYSIDQMLKAYLYVLGEWGYPFHCSDASDETGQGKFLTMRIDDDRLRQAHPLYHYSQMPHWCAAIENMLEIKGYPNDFAVRFVSATWRFDTVRGFSVERV